MNIELDLITACINRERRAEYELYKLTYSYLMSICIRYTNNREEAEDGLNIGFLKILQNLNKYRAEVPFKAWVRKVMVNTLIDEYRKQKKHQEQIKYVEDYIETSDFADVNNALTKMNTEQIHTMIKKLPPTSQQVFNLYAIDGFAHKEIAELLDMSEGTSKWHVSFSRQQLKEMIEKMVSPKTIVS
jgi:RNA polymerase sigma-70 factor (ECF subfamily)